MDITAEQFRQDFNEFADPLVYSDNAINFQLAVVSTLLSQCRWDTLFNYGVELYVAHLLVLARRAALASLSGGVPGTPQGLLTAKQIDKVSASYDVQAITIEGAGWYNQTTYGQQLWMLIQRIGAGPIQIDAGSGPSGVYPFLGVDYLNGY